MRLKTLSCREKLSFMAGVLRSKGSEAECAHKLIVPVPRCPDPGTRAGWGRGGGATPALLGQEAVLPPGKEVGCKSRAGCARPPAVLEGISDGAFQVLRSFWGFSAPRPTGSSLVPGSASTSNRLQVDARPRPRTRSGPAPCGRSGWSHAVAVATRVICVPGSPWRGHGHPAAVPAQVEAPGVQRGVDASAAAEAEGGGALQKLQLSGVEDHR